MSTKINENRNATTRFFSEDLSSINVPKCDSLPGITKVDYFSHFSLQTSFCMDGQKLCIISGYEFSADKILAVYLSCPQDKEDSSK